MAISRDKTCWIDAGYVASSVYIGFVPSAKAWARTMKHLAVTSPYPTAAGMCTVLTDKKGTVTCLVTISEDHDKGDLSNGLNITSILAHEATHVFQHLCDKIGEYKPSDEFEAYFIQNIYGDLADAYCATRRELFKVPYKRTRARIQR